MGNDCLYGKAALELWAGHLAVAIGQATGADQPAKRQIAWRKQ
jgi:hypothetical protein